ncbi:DNA ligase (NAD+), partial [Ehrlichia ruminantium]|uniref:hypothetical protein n=1 Tax=Ehrlichia ruminantium TaxID=779 RepID=UPI0007C114ED
IINYECQYFSIKKMETIDGSFLITLKNTNLLTSSNNPGSKYKKHNLSIYKSCLNENLFFKYI